MESQSGEDDCAAPTQCDEEASDSIMDTTPKKSPKPSLADGNVSNSITNGESKVAKIFIDWNFTQKAKGERPVHPKNMTQKMVKQNHLNRLYCSY